MLCKLMNMQSTVDINFIVLEIECGLEYNTKIIIEKVHNMLIMFSIFFLSVDVSV
jgi:hypothetical protein